MSRATDYAVSDLWDCINILTKMIEELNPGATKDVSHIRFLLERANRSLEEADQRYSSTLTRTTPRL